MYKFLPILLFALGLAVTIDEIYDNSYALIIGIDKYENVSNLDYAVKDANSIASLLIDNFNFLSKNVKVLQNKEATFINVRNSLAEISKTAKVNDRVLIYFAGHGVTADLPDGGELGYLLPVDGVTDNLYASAIPMNDLKDLSYMSNAKHMLFLVDACYGGLATVGTRGLDAKTTPNYIEKITNIKSRQIITAGGRTEEVIEKPEWGHSAYTMNLLRALGDGLADANEDGYITADELGDYLREKVTIDSENQQTPQSRRLTSHEGEFIFIASDDEYSPLKYDKGNYTVNSEGVALPSDWGTISRKDRLKKKMDENSWSEEPTGFGEGFFGCMDSNATNYNQDAWEDDGSCIYTEENNKCEDWEDCPGCYEFTATMTAGVYDEGGMTLGDDGDILAALDADGVVRGLGTMLDGIGSTEGQTLHAITIRSNQGGDAISFQYYDASEDEVMKSSASYSFVINENSGNLMTPYTLNIVSGNEECEDTDDVCSWAPAQSGCDFIWDSTLLSELCPKTCGLCFGIKFSIGDYATEIIADRQGGQDDYLTIDIIIDSDTPIAGFQFDITGVTVTGASGGAAEEADFMIFSSATTVLGFSWAGDTIPIGKSVLVTLDINIPIGNTLEICIENVTLSSSEGEALEFEVDNCKKIK